LDDPAAAIGNWDKGIDVMNDLMGFPRVRGKETVYTQADVIMRSTVYAPGYPAVNVKEDSPSSDRGGDTGSYLVYGPNYQEGSAKTEIHEQGHAYFFDKFAGETESAVNLHYVAIMNQAFGFDLDYSLAASRGTQDNPHQTLNNTAIEWMTSFNFSPREVEMHTAEKAYQLKGHAKFVDIAKLFGWEVINDYYKQLVLENTSASSDDDRILRMSREAGVDLRPLFHFWGIHPSDPTSLKSAIESEGLVPSSDIYARLMEYKSILPDGNAAFRTYCLNWWGRKPSEDGKWTESEHARQWDTTELWEGEDDVQQRPDITEAEMYTEAVAADIRDYVQDIIDMYFPDGPPHFHGELGNDIASWTGQTVPVTATVTNNTDSTLNYTWSIEPQTGAAFSANGDQASVTITKPAGDPASYKLSFTVDDGGTNPSVIDVVIITVYDDACQATRLGLGQQNKYDIHPDCEVNIADIAAMLSSWLEDNRLKTPIIKQ